MDEQDAIDKLINLRRWAVVGASNNPDKYGHRIYLSLRRAGYQVAPVNPREAEIAGDLAFPSLADLPEPPEVVDLVVPPAATLDVVKAAAARGVTGVWFQPGSENDEAIRFAESAGLVVVHGGPCAMVEKRQWVS